MATFTGKAGVVQTGSNALAEVGLTVSHKQVILQNQLQWVTQQKHLKLLLLNFQVQ